MVRILVILFCLAFPNLLSAQVVIHCLARTPGDKDNHSMPIGGVMVSIEGFSVAVTNAKGEFSLQSQYLHHGDRIEIRSIRKNGYVLLNEDDVKCYTVSRDNKLVLVLMTKTDYDNRRRKIEEVSKAYYEKSILKETSKLKEELANDENKQNYLNELNEQYQAKLLRLPSIIENLIKTMDYDSSDDIQKLIYSKIEEGKLDEALNMLDDLIWVRKNNIDDVSDDYYQMFLLCKNENPEMAKNLINTLISKYKSNHKWLIEGANFYAEIEDYNKAIEYYNECLELLSKNDEKSKAQIYKELSSIYSVLDDDSKAIELAQQAIQTARQVSQGDSTYIAPYIVNLGRIYTSKSSSESDYKKALGYFEEVLKLLSNNYDRYQLLFAECNNYMGVIYQDMGTIKRNSGANDISLDYYEKALYYYNESLEIRMLSEDEQTLNIGVTYNNIGCVLDDLEDYDQAIEYYDKGIKVFEESPIYKNNLSTLYHNKASSYKSQKKMDKAKEMDKLSQTIMFK